MKTPLSERERTETLLHDLLAKATTEEQVDTARNSLLSGLFSKTDAKRPPPLAGSPARTEWPRPPAAKFPRLKQTDRRSDFVLAALGVTLGLICALFPWYIFFNPDQFGVQTIKFGGKGDNSGRVVVSTSATSNIALEAQDNLSKNLDLFSTGNIPAPAETAKKPVDAGQQPYPADKLAFRLIHVANGRAMIEDDAGLWMVQKGSKLPDSSHVASIERRNGNWVLVTSTDQVVPISKVR